MLDRHPDEKGLIHTGSTKMAKFLASQLEEYEDRIILAFGSLRQPAFEKHMDSPDPTVLLSPSMYEGVDLKDDAARFLVIVKCPFMSLGDKQTKRRADQDNEWYKMHAVRQIIQACGRGNRSEDDACVTYVCDAKVYETLDSMSSHIPQWFKDAWEEE